MDSEVVAGDVATGSGANVGAAVDDSVGVVADDGADDGGSSGVLVGAGLSAGRSVVTVVVPLSQASIDPTARRPTNPNQTTSRPGRFTNRLHIKHIQTAPSSQFWASSRPNEPLTAHCPALQVVDVDAAGIHRRIIAEGCPTSNIELAG